MPFMPKFKQFLTQVLEVVGGVALVLMTLAVTINVFGRLFFQSPLFAMVEVVGLAGVFLISAAVGFTEKERGHIFINILFDRLPRRLRSVLSILILIVSIIVIFFLGFGGLLMVIDDLTTPGATTHVLQLNTGYFIAAWVVGCFILCIFLVQHLAERMKNK